MLSIKQQLAYLKNAKLALIEHFKKQKLEQSQFTNTEQLYTSNINNTKDRESI